MLRYVPKREFDRILGLDVGRYEKARLFADACRINILYMIQRAGSGHIGSSFSAIDIVTWLYLFEIGDKDVYFSSKGHDCPALYAVLTALGIMDFDLIHRFRRFGGLPGHPIVNPEHPGIYANTGSLGMGISKAKGMLIAARLSGEDRRVFVMVGDGELQEGQIWESLQGASNEGLVNLVVIVDSNKVQSDFPVGITSYLGSAKYKFAAFDWEVDVRVVSGGSKANNTEFEFNELDVQLRRPHYGLPRVIYVETTKGCGVPFMESPPGFWEGAISYPYHSGPLAPEEYDMAVNILSGIDDEGKSKYELVLTDEVSVKTPGSVVDLVAAYSNALVALAEKDNKIVVLDADLVKDCGLLEFRRRFPERFIECGIAEQDMVSQASGLALMGYKPIVHSFATFLTQRANDQIYNQLTENTSVIYVGFLAGLLPATPGVSHQGVRDMAVMSAMPGMDIYAPGTESDVREVLWNAIVSDNSSYIRICSYKTERPVEGLTIRDHHDLSTMFIRGDDLRLITYGPVMLNESIKASDILSKEGIGTTVINWPWITRDPSLVKGIKTLIVDDHYYQGGLHDRIDSIKPAYSLSIKDEFPACGQADEVLHYHRMDAESIASTIRELLNDARNRS